MGRYLTSKIKSTIIKSLMQDISFMNLRKMYGRVNPINRSFDFV